MANIHETIPNTKATSSTATIATVTSPIITAYINRLPINGYNKYAPFSINKSNLRN